MLLREGGSVSGGSNRELSAMRSPCMVPWGVLLFFFLSVGISPRIDAAEPLRLFRMSKGSPSPYDQRRELISSLPLDRLTADARGRILAIAKSPTLYRRLPTQAITCEPEMFLFLTRQPEVMVGIWELMGITQVQTQRKGPYHLLADDGSGTECSVDLVYGDTSLHLYTAEGSYDGPLVAGAIRGRGVFVVRSSYATGSVGQTTVTGTIDCFVQIDNLGADLIARTLSGLIGRSADYNFTETARFMSQVSLASQQNTAAMIDVAKRISQVDEPTRQGFIELIGSVASKPSAKRIQGLLESDDEKESAGLENRGFQNVGIPDSNFNSVEPETASASIKPGRFEVDRTALGSRAQFLR